MNASDPSRGGRYSGKPLSYAHPCHQCQKTLTGNPSWLTINPSTGLMTGTPTTTGTYSISIGVSDGALTASLQYVLTVNPASSTTATVSWTPPTQNTDGSTLALSSIDSYTIYYGLASNQLNQTVPNIAGSSTSYTVTGLSSGTYFFAMTTTVGGVESDKSNPASKVIP